MPLRRLQLHDRVNIRAIKPMTDRDYTVRGCTALLDAIGGAIHHISNVHKYARQSDVPKHTLFIITTDGMENASRFYSSDRVKQMIERGDLCGPRQRPARRRLEVPDRRGLRKTRKRQKEISCTNMRRGDGVSHLSLFL